MRTIEMRASLIRVLASVLVATAGLSLIGAEPTGELAEKLAAVKFDRLSAAPGYSEGPTWRAGEVFFCSGALLRVDAQKKLPPSLVLGPAGTVLRADGHLLVCDNKYKAVLDVSGDGK